MFDYLSSIGKSLNHKYEQLRDQQLRIAVTGLSRAGKTAFITSFINQLLTLNQDTQQISEFKPAQQKHIIGVQIVPQTDLTVPTFTYKENLKQLQQDPPQWPLATTDLSEIRLAIRYVNDKSLLSKIATVNFADVNTLYVDLIDYPGEWLLDLPLLNLSYQQWSMSPHFLTTSLRKQLAQEWLEQLKQLDLNAQADPDALATIAASYTKFLHQCKQHGLEFIQPGRFVLPGDKAGSPILRFFPLVHIEPQAWKKLSNTTTTGQQSNFGLLLQAYEAYKQTFVESFYQEHFKRFDRQIILLDCLTPLSKGKEALEEAQYAMQQIFAHFSYGSRNLWSRLFSPRIDKLLFAATKLDHVNIEQMANLHSLLEQLTQESNSKARYENIKTKYLVLSAIRATEHLQIQENNHTYNVLRGLDKESQQLKIVHPDPVPPYIPRNDYWQQLRPDYDQFLPLPLTAKGKIRQINMGMVLDFLLSDKL